jgi:hypothetical protein
MSGGGSDDLMYIAMLFLVSQNSSAPTTVLIGFGITVYAILKIQKV